MIIDQYIIILIAAGDTGCKDKFFPFLEGVFDFIEQIVNIEGFSNPRVLKMIISLIGDIATSFPQNLGVKTKAT